MLILFCASKLKTIEKCHGILEKRIYYYSTDIEWMINAKSDWTSLL